MLVYFIVLVLTCLLCVLFQKLQFDLFGEDEHTYPNYKLWDKIYTAGIVIFGYAFYATIAFGLVYIVGWIWYYLCAGAIVMEQESTFDIIVGGAVSIALLVWVIGIIAVILKGGK